MPLTNFANILLQEIPADVRYPASACAMQTILRPYQAVCNNIHQIKTASYFLGLRDTSYTHPNHKNIHKGLQYNSIYKCLCPDCEACTLTAARASAAMLLAILRATTQSSSCKDGWPCGASLCILHACGLAALRSIGLWDVSCLSSTCIPFKLFNKGAYILSPMPISCSNAGKCMYMHASAHI